MKTIITHARLALIAIVALFTVTLAQATPTTGTEKNPSGVEFKFIGNHKNQPVLELSFNNPEEVEFTVEVVDEYNTVLYKDVVKANNTTKKFLLNTEELGNVGLRFHITGRKSNKTVVYEVNRSARMVEDLVVNKIK